MQYHLYDKDHRAKLLLFFLHRYNNLRKDHKARRFLYEQRFHPFQVGKHHGEVDSEYKFFEYASVIAGDGEKHSLKILSERNMCKSCRFVMDEFKAIYPNVEVEVVSHKEDKAAKNKNKNRIFEIDVKLRKKDANNR